MNDFHLAGLRYKFIYSMSGLILGLACIVTGALLGLYGVTGHTGMVAKFLGLDTQLNDAPPGVVVFVIGVFMVVATRFKVRVKEIEQFTPPLGDHAASPSTGSLPSSDQPLPPGGGAPPPSRGGGGGGGGSGFNRAVREICYAPPKWWDRV